MLEVRILPGEPKLFNINKLQGLGRAFGSQPNGRIFFQPIGAPRFGLLLEASTTITDWTLPKLRLVDLAVPCLLPEMDG